MKALHTSELSAPPLNGHERRRAATREKVLAAARELVDEAGREALTVVGVAARAGVSEGTVYKIFSSRDDLTAAATLGVSELWIDAVADTPASQHPLHRLLRAHRAVLRDISAEEVLLRTIAAKGPKTTTELGLRYQAQEMLVRSCAAGLTRSSRSALTHEDALLWSQVYVALLRTARMHPGEPDQLVLLQTYIDTVTS